MNIKTAKMKIINMLRKHLNNSTNCAFETNLIFTHVLKITLNELLLTTEISDKNFKKIENIAKKRAAHHPLQYLLASWPFYNVTVKLSSKVLIPRSESEMLVNFALGFKQNKLNIVDLCCGSGALSLAIAFNKPNAKIKAIDLSPYAIKCTKQNTSKFKNRIQIIEKSVFNENLAKNFKNWANLIICNPPYLNQTDMKNLQPELKFEPKMALYGGETGLIFYEKICKLWKICLKNSGWIAFEIGFNQKNAVESFLRTNGFSKVKTFKDYYKNDRMTIAQKIN